MSVAVLSYNIHKGMTTLNRKNVLALIRQSLQATPVDFVFLQEVVGDRNSEEFIPDWPSNAQFEYLADQIWHHYAYGKNAVYDVGHHGNAILSRYPILNSENIDISTNKYEQRGLLYCLVEHPVTKMHFHLVCLHLNLREAGRQAQLVKVIRKINEAVPAGDPLLVCGDFNDWRESASDIFSTELHLREAFQQTEGRHARTFPSALPVLKLDRIYFRNLRLNACQRLRGNPWQKLSDHIPVTAHFALPHQYK